MIYDQGLSSSKNDQKYHDWGHFMVLLAIFELDKFSEVFWSHKPIFCEEKATN